MGMSDYTVPDPGTLPLPSARSHPAQADIHGYTVDFLRQYDLMASSDVERFLTVQQWPRCAALVYPSCDLAVAASGCVAMCLGTLTQEHIDSPDPLTAHQLYEYGTHIINALTDTGPDRAAPPLAHAWHALWKELHRFASDRWIDRLRRHILQVSAAYPEEAEVRRHRTILDFDEAFALHARTHGHEIFFALIEPGLGFEIADPLYHQPGIHRFRHRHYSATVLCNDLLGSVPADLRNGNPVNTVLAHRQTHGCSLQEAIDAVWRHTATLLAQAGADKEQITADIDKLCRTPQQAGELTAYLDAIEQFTIGYATWRATTGRATDTHTYLPRPGS